MCTNQEQVCIIMIDDRRLRIEVERNVGTIKNTILLAIGLAWKPDLLANAYGIDHLLVPGWRPSCHFHVSSTPTRIGIGIAMYNV